MTLPKHPVTILSAKVAVFTCILPWTYTSLMPPLYINADFSQVHYWAITNHQQGLYPWFDWVVPRDPNLTSRRDLQKYKMLSHLLLPEYDWIIFVDGWTRLKVDPIQLVSEVKESGKKLAFVKHPWRDCSYEEGRVCAGFNSQNGTIINAQLARYEGEGFPHNFGLVASSFFVRDNNAPEVAEFFELWYKETVEGSHRNQISWGVAAWRSRLDILVWDVPWGENRFY